MIGLKIIADSHKSMTPNFVVAVNVLLPICCHIGSGMPYLLIFGEEIVAISGAITINRWSNFSVVGIRKQAMTRSSLQQKI